MSPRAIILWDSFRLGAISDTPRSATRQAAPPNRVERAGAFGSGAVPVGNFLLLVSYDSGGRVYEVGTAQAKWTPLQKFMQKQYCHRL